MSTPTIYSGPAKVVHAFGSGPTLYSFFADGENGAVKLAINEKRTQRSTANFGYHQSTLDDQTAEISLTPFDMWALIPVLYPTYLGVTNGSNTGALAWRRPGRPMGNMAEPRRLRDRRRPVLSRLQRQGDNWLRGHSSFGIRH